LNPNFEYGFQKYRKQHLRQPRPIVMNKPKGYTKEIPEAKRISSKQLGLLKMNGSKNLRTPLPIKVIGVEKKRRLKILDAKEVADWENEGGKVLQKR
jgi:hypothetical protein